MEILLVAAAVGGNVFGAAMVVPQVARMLRVRRYDGVSATWAMLSITVNAAWIAYALGVGDPAILGISVVASALYVAVLILIQRHSPTPGRPALLLLSAAAVLAGPLLALKAGGWPAFGVVLGAFYGVQLAPAVFAVARSADVSGVSTLTWILAWSEAASWAIYGVGRSDAGLISHAVAGATMSTAVLVLLMWKRRPGDHIRQPRRTRLANAVP